MLKGFFGYLGLLGLVAENHYTSRKINTAHDELVRRGCNREKNYDVQMQKREKVREDLEGDMIFVPTPLREYFKHGELRFVAMASWAQGCEDEFVIGAGYAPMSTVGCFQRGLVNPYERFNRDYLPLIAEYNKEHGLPEPKKCYIGMYWSCQFSLSNT